MTRNMSRTRTLLSACWAKTSRHTTKTSCTIIASRSITMNSGLSEPLQGGSGGDESGSQGGASSSQHSSGGGGSSLLERIQMQRQREQAALQQQQQQQTPQQIQVPNYGEAASSSMPGFGSSSPNDKTNGSESNFFSSAWSNISQSMETGSAEQNDMESALLAPASGEGLSANDENYSMQNYFMTFVKDVYGLFLRFPVPARVVVVIGLLYIALKLL